MRLPPLLSGAQAEGAKYAQVGDRSPWPLEAAIRRYSKPLADLVARDANEGDTRLLITSIRTFHHWLRAQRCRTLPSIRLRHHTQDVTWTPSR